MSIVKVAKIRCDLCEFEEPWQGSPGAEREQLNEGWCGFDVWIGNYQRKTGHVCPRCIAGRGATPPVKLRELLPRGSS